MPIGPRRSPKTSRPSVVAVSEKGDLLVGNVAQIVSGLTVGEQVIMMGIVELMEGAVITISKG